MTLFTCIDSYNEKSLCTHIRFWCSDSGSGQSCQQKQQQRSMSRLEWEETQRCQRPEKVRWKLTLLVVHLLTHILTNRVSKWLEDEPERKKRRREEKRKRLLQKKVPPKHFFDDQAYMEQLRSNEEGMDSALKQGTLSSTYFGLWFTVLLW